MSFVIEERASDEPSVQTIWRTHSQRPGTFTSVAVSRWEMVVTRRRGRVTLTVRGPETAATRAPIPSDAEFFGIAFEHGAYMPSLPPRGLIDGAIELPPDGESAFWLNGRRWPLPTFENADTFVRRLVRQGALVLDPVVRDALGEGRLALSSRSLRRRCLRAIGLTPGMIRQIDRARQAAARLQGGASILDTVNEAGYFDQPHLTRALKRFTGHTPAAILRMNGFAEMSLSYKTSEFGRGY